MTSRPLGSVYFSSKSFTCGSLAAGTSLAAARVTVPATSERLHAHTSARRAIADTARPNESGTACFMGYLLWMDCGLGGLLSGNTEIRPGMFRQDAPQVKASRRIS